MKKTIDLTTPLYKYKVLMAQTEGFYVTVDAGSVEEAMSYANDPQMRQHWHKYDRKVVEIASVSAELITKYSM